MKKYYKAKLMLYNRVENGEDFTYHGEIIVKKGIVGYNEICTGKGFNFYEKNPIYSGFLANKRIFHITDLDNDIKKEEVINYIENFDYDRFEEIILFSGRKNKKLVK